MAKLNKKGLEETIAKLKELNNKGVKYGIYGHKARRRAKNSKITLGHLANILEEGRTYRHSGGVVPITNHAGEVRFITIKPGTIIHIPRRPFFLRAYWNIKRNIPDIANIQFRLFIMNKNSVDNFLKQIGEYCKESVLNSIDRDGGYFASLGELQVWKKGHNKPFVDSGKLREAVDYQIIKR